VAPILFPVAMKLGIDPVHFGIIMVVNMEVGMYQPPVGLNLYVASGITKMGITELTIAVWPWLLTMLVFLVVVTYWPALSIWLPKTLGMMRLARVRARPRAGRPASRSKSRSWAISLRRYRSSSQIRRSTHVHSHDAR